MEVLERQRAETSERAALWHPTRNAPLQLTDVSCGSHKRVWWQCDQGHEWQAKIYTVMKDGSGCPYCAGRRVVSGETDLLTLYPNVAAQWDSEKNGTLTPDMVLPSAHDKVWWRCELGHSWQAAVFSRTGHRSSGCPYCTGRKVLEGFNDLGTLMPTPAKEWHRTLNGTLTPAQVTPGSNKRVWWQCGEGHVWQAAVYSRTRRKGTGCPICAGTAKQKKTERHRTVSS